MYNLSTSFPLLMNCSRCGFLVNVDLYFSTTEIERLQEALAVILFGYALDTNEIFARTSIISYKPLKMSL